MKKKLWYLQLKYVQFVVIIEMCLLKPKIFFILQKNLVLIEKLNTKIYIKKKCIET